MVGKGACYTAAPQERVWLQSHTSPLALLCLCGGLNIEWLCTENLRRKKDMQSVEQIIFLCYCIFTQQPEEGDITSSKIIRYVRVQTDDINWMYDTNMNLF